MIWIMLHLAIEIDAETNDMHWLGFPYCSHPDIDYWGNLLFIKYYLVTGLADISYIADKKENVLDSFSGNTIHNIQTR